MLNLQNRIPISRLAAFFLSPLNVFIFSILLLSSGCLTTSQTNIASQWPLQSGSEDVYQYYEGESLPLEEVAILDVPNPLGIMKQIRTVILFGTLAVFLYLINSGIVSSERKSVTIITVASLL